MISFIGSPSSLYLLTALVAAGAFLHLYGTAFHTRQLAWPFKPFPVFILLLYLTLQPHQSFYTILIATGLFFSFIGDIFLLQEDRFFIQGLVSFLVAHLFYIGGLVLQTGWQPIHIIPFILIFVAFWMIFRRIQDNLKSLTLPVILYIIVIGVMVWRAFCRLGYQDILGDGVWWTALGALLFMTSDLFLALHKFDRPLKNRDNCVMIPYYLGQYGMALSALHFFRLSSQ